MVFERISLIDIYDALKGVESNEGKISNILLTRSSKRGSRTLPKFSDLSSLKSYIDTNYPYRTSKAPECECLTCSGEEGIIKLLSFKIDNKITIQNIREVLTSYNLGDINGMSIKLLQQLNIKQGIVGRYYSDSICEQYVNQYSVIYWTPCSYIGIVQNQTYKDLITALYEPTNRPDFPTKTTKIC